MAKLKGQSRLAYTECQGTRSVVVVVMDDFDWLLISSGVGRWERCGAVMR